MSLYLSGINYESISDAPGVSCTVFFSGCDRNCKGCHSPEAQNPVNGTPVTDKLIKEIGAEINKRPFLKSLVLSGGDPMYSHRGVLHFIRKLMAETWNSMIWDSVWCYTGLLFEEILFKTSKNRTKRDLLVYIDVVVDGEYKEELRDITLKFRGSSNQRIINVPASLRENKTILWEDN